MNKLYLPIFFIYLAISTVSAQKLELHFFGSKTCGECYEIKADLLLPLITENGDSLDIKFYDIEEKSDFETMLKFDEKFNIDNGSPQELFFADTFLLGFEDIMSLGGGMILDYLAKKEVWSNPVPTSDKKLEDNLQKKIDTSFSFWGITLAGVADGVNPCAIATMIFLISFLATQKKKKGEVLLIGLSFTLSVFVTYTLLGAGAFKGITALEKYHWVSQFIKWSAVLLAGVVGVISFWDALIYSKTKKSKNIKLQLPKSIKLQIHKVISGNLKSGNLVWGAIVTGFLVTLLEAVCTGQVYLPTIALMTRVEGFQGRGWILLIYYNFLFVLPLLIVMFAAYAGLTWDKLAKTTSKNLTYLKLLLGTVMLLLAWFLAIH
jgi:cytochrome c biogenesis protein CcdA